MEWSQPYILYLSSIFCFTFYDKQPITTPGQKAIIETNEITKNNKHVKVATQGQRSPAWPDATPNLQQ